MCASSQSSSALCPIPFLPIIPALPQLMSFPFHTGTSQQVTLWVDLEKESAESAGFDPARDVQPYLGAVPKPFGKQWIYSSTGRSVHPWIMWQKDEQVPWTDIILQKTPVYRLDWPRPEHSFDRLEAFLSKGVLVIYVGKDRPPDAGTRRWTILDEAEIPEKQKVIVMQKQKDGVMVESAKKEKEFKLHTLKTDIAALDVLSSRSSDSALIERIYQEKKVDAGRGDQLYGVGKMELERAKAEMKRGNVERARIDVDIAKRKIDDQAKHNARTQRTNHMSSMKQRQLSKSIESAVAVEGLSSGESGTSRARELSSGYGSAVGLGNSSRLHGGRAQILHAKRRLFGNNSSEDTPMDTPFKPLVGSSRESPAHDSGFGSSSTDPDKSKATSEEQPADKPVDPWVGSSRSTGSDSTGTGKDKGKAREVSPPPVAEPREVKSERHASKDSDAMERLRQAN